MNRNTNRNNKPQLSMNIKDDKNLLRNHMRQLKKQMPLDIKISESVRVFEQLEKMPGFAKSKVLLLYWSMDDEIQTHKFIQKWGQVKTILLPVVSGLTLKLKQYEGITSMKPGEAFGILEPTGAEFTDYDKIEMIIVPGVAFDKANNRLGRGKGYYDKLLSITDAIKIGVCFSFQYVDRLPVEAHDLPMDKVIAG